LDAHASHPTRCPDGRYQVDGPPLLRTSDAIVIDHGRVAIEGLCNATPAKIREQRDGGHSVRARWSKCGRMRRVELRAVVAPGCEELRGKLGVRRHRPAQRFTASRCDDHLGCRSACTSNADCATSQWCAKPAGDCDAAGVCTERIEGGCPLYLDPVCGCDGQTYGNACEALISHVNVEHAGTCEATCDADSCAIAPMTPR
jgi:hypothetical protein